VADQLLCLKKACVPFRTRFLRSSSLPLRARVDASVGKGQDSKDQLFSVMTSRERQGLLWRPVFRPGRDLLCLEVRCAQCRGKHNASQHSVKVVPVSAVVWPFESVDRFEHVPQSALMDTRQARSRRFLPSGFHCHGQKVNLPVLPHGAIRVPAVQVPVRHCLGV
jgi:hypothetical protein